MSEQHSSPIKTPKQLVIVVVLAFVVPITLIILVSQLVTGHSKGAQESSEATLQRIRPVGELHFADTAAADAAPITAPVQAPAAVPTASAAAAAAPPAVAAPAASNLPAPGATIKVTPADKGKAIFESTCVACHGTGAAGAPKAGDRAVWEPRIKAGKAALYNSAVKGKNAMPPKGGNLSLSEDDVKAAVDYLVGLAQ